ncbi:MAG: hypothetical protein WCA20_22405, partial [Candidatus Sulfotelmatobacter sp.]
LESHNPCCGKALEHADSFLFWCWGGIRPRNRVMPESGIPEFDTGRIKQAVQREGVCTGWRQPPTGGISYKEKHNE